MYNSRPSKASIASRPERHPKPWGTDHFPSFLCELLLWALKTINVIISVDNIIVGHIRIIPWSRKITKFGSLRFCKHCPMSLISFRKVTVWHIRNSQLYIVSKNWTWSLTVLQWTQVKFHDNQGLETFNTANLPLSWWNLSYFKAQEPMEEEPAAPATGGDAPAALWQLKSLWNLKLFDGENRTSKGVFHVKISMRTGI